MPELPEVESFRKYIEATSHGNRVQEIVVSGGRVVRPVSPDTLISKVQGREFRRTLRHGKNLFIGTDVEDIWIYFHFGMTGRPVFITGDEEAPRYARVVFRFVSDGALVFRDPRQFGRVSLVQNPEDFIRDHRLGPDPLDSEFDLACFRTILDGKNGGAKAVLMDQHVMAGIGNLYADEILFQARIHPLTPVSRLYEADIERLFLVMKEILQKAVDFRAEYQRYPDAWIIHRRKEGEPCPCGGAVSRMKAAGRTTYYCPECQKRK